MVFVCIPNRLCRGGLRMILRPFQNFKLSNFQNFKFSTSWEGVGQGQGRPLGRELFTSSMIVWRRDIRVGGGS